MTIEKTGKTAVFLQTHFINSYIKDLFQKILSEAPTNHDVYLLYNCGDGPISVPPEGQDIHDQGRLVLSNTAKFISLGFPRKSNADGWTGNGWTMVPGNCDMNIVLFYNEFPGYDYYWGIEYDVHFEGNWAFLFKHFEKSDADLLGTTMYGAYKTSQKGLNPPMRYPDGTLYDVDKAIRGFYPICRMSRAGLQLITEEYKKGWDGHQELLLGTILNDNGMKLEDIGGNGDYVKPENKDVFYFNNANTFTMRPGNFVFRPSFKKVLPKINTLWHPIKPDGDYHIHSQLKHPIADLLNFWIKPAFAKIALHAWFLTVWRKKAG